MVLTWLTESCERIYRLEWKHQRGLLALARIQHNSGKLCLTGFHPEKGKQMTWLLRGSSHLFVRGHAPAHPFCVLYLKSHFIALNTSLRLPTSKVYMRSIKMRLPPGRSGLRSQQLPWSVTSLRLVQLSFISPQRQFMFWPCALAK